MNAQQTKQQLNNGGYLGVVNILTNLRRICNHPLLLENQESDHSLTFGKGVWAWNNCGESDYQNRKVLYLEGQDFQYKIFREFAHLEDMLAQIEYQATPKDLEALQWFREEIVRELLDSNPEP